MRSNRRTFEAILSKTPLCTEDPWMQNVVIAVKSVAKSESSSRMSTRKSRTAWNVKKTRREMLIAMVVYGLPPGLQAQCSSSKTLTTVLQAQKASLPLVLHHLSSQTIRYSMISVVLRWDWLFEFSCALKTAFSCDWLGFSIPWWFAAVLAGSSQTVHGWFHPWFCTPQSSPANKSRFDMYYVACGTRVQRLVVS